MNAQVESALIEMSWGNWEGKTLAQLRQQDPVYVTEQESLGLDLRPVGGESPRLVAKRVSAWIEALDIVNVEQRIGCV